MQHIVTSIQRLGFTATATLEQKRLAVDLCEVAIKWEVQRAKETDSGAGEAEDADSKRSLGSDGLPDPKKPKLMTPVKTSPESNKPVDKSHADNIVNYLLRLACQVSDTQATTGGSPGETDENMQHINNYDDLFT